MYGDGMAACCEFQSTSPVWGTTPLTHICIRSPTFQSTSPVWGTTSCAGVPVSSSAHFNPRPPCGGRQYRLRTGRQGRLYFNPRPPCGGRHSSCALATVRSLFQSTSPVWGTTKYIYSNCCCNRYFNPRPPCGGRQILDVDIHNSIFISIHVPRVGDDD